MGILAVWLSFCFHTMPVSAMYLTAVLCRHVPAVAVSFHKIARSLHTQSFTTLQPISNDRFSVVTAWTQHA